MAEAWNPVWVLRRGSVHDARRVGQRIEHPLHLLKASYYRQDLVILTVVDEPLLRAVAV